MANNKIIKYKKWVFAILLFVAIQIISINPFWVERYYTYGAYPPVARLLRVLFGWLPFSLGDIVYLIAGVSIIYNVIKFIRSFFKKKVSRTNIFKWIRSSGFIILIVFILFYGLWGLNYSRVGIAGQLKLAEQEYTNEDLDSLVNMLHTRLNNYAALITPATRESFKTKKNLFSNAALLYQLAVKKYHFLTYRTVSVKPSLYSYAGNYLGFQGYYNPFTGEAQINTTVPQCEEPFVMSHEIAHQLGYAKESEANFVGFLACRLHPSVNFKYSVYFDMYHYAIREFYYNDSLKAKAYDSTLNIQVKKDRAELISFYKKYRNPIEPYISELYSYFLKANNQPKGKQSYNEVVTWLIAYYKKYGKDEI